MLDQNPQWSLDKAFPSQIFKGPLRPIIQFMRGTKYQKCNKEVCFVSEIISSSDPDVEWHRAGVSISVMFCLYSAHCTSVKETW